MVNLEKNKIIFSYKFCDFGNYTWRWWRHWHWKLFCIITADSATFSVLVFTLNRSKNQCIWLYMLHVHKCFNDHSIDWHSIQWFFCCCCFWMKHLQTEWMVHFNRSSYFKVKITKVLNHPNNHWTFNVIWLNVIILT